MSGDKSAMTPAERQAWRSRMVEELGDNEFFTCLGVIGGKHHFLIKATGDVVALRHVSGYQISKLAPQNWWAERFPSDKTTGYALLEVVNFLYRASEDASRQVRAAVAKKAVEKARAAAADVF
ncbi:hypothetical protein [Paraburkholderia hospita]|uniref:hypothetical protein n=1 Tax=Paraburkholderia hospita TaxID=169430 RepID=UPI003ECDA074